MFGQRFPGIVAAGRIEAAIIPQQWRKSMLVNGNYHIEEIDQRFMYF